MRGCGRGRDFLVGRGRAFTEAVLVELLGVVSGLWSVGSGSACILSLDTHI